MESIIKELENNKQLLLESHIFTRRQYEVVIKRLLKQKLRQSEANYLSKFIKPKIIASKFITNIELQKYLEDQRKKRFVEKIYFAGKEKMINKRSMETKSMIKKFENEFPSSQIIVFGGFLFNEVYNDIDVIIISGIHSDNVPKKQGIYHIHFMASAHDDPLLFNSIAQTAVSNMKLKQIKYTPNFDDFIEFNFLIDDLLNRNFSQAILNKFRALALIHCLIKKNILLDSISLEMELKNLIPGYNNLKNKKYNKIKSGDLLNVAKRLISESLLEICKNNEKDKQTLESNLRIFKKIKDKAKLQKLIYSIYQEVHNGCKSG